MFSQSRRRPLQGPSPGWRVNLHCAKWVLTPLWLDVKLGCQRNYHKGRAAIRHYAHQTALVGAFSVIVQLHRLIVYTALQLTLAQSCQGTTVSCLQLISLWGPASALSTSHFFSNFKHLSSASAYLLCRFWICQKKISLYNWHYLSYLRFNCMKRRQYHIVVDFIYYLLKKLAIVQG